MSSGAISESTRSWTETTAVVVTDATATERWAARLLDAAGFRIAGVADGGLGADARPAGDITVLLLSSSAAARVEAIAATARLWPHAPLLATMPAGAPGRLLRRALQRGADGIVFDDEIAVALVPSARALMAGQLAVPRRLRRQVAPRALSHREKEILALVVLGHTNAQIAAALFVAESTVKTHLSSAFVKLDAGSRAEAAALILDPDAGYDVGLPPTISSN